MIRSNLNYLKADLNQDQEYQDRSKDKRPHEAKDADKTFIMSQVINSLIIRPDPDGGSAEGPKNFATLLRNNQHVGSLVFDEYALAPNQSHTLDGLCFPNLMHLMVTLRGIKTQNCKAQVVQLGKMRMPRLINLRLDSVLQKGEEGNALMYVALYEFLTEYAHTVKRLTFRHLFKAQMTIGRRMSDDPLEEEELNKKLKCKLKELKLQELTLFLDHYEGWKNFDLGLHILSIQTHLVKLQIQISDGNPELFYEATYLAINNNRGTLRHVCITRNLITSNIDDLENILIALKSCPRMESLRLFVFTVPTFPQPLPPTLRYLDLTGSLHPNVLVEIKNNCPQLEELHFINLSSDFEQFHSDLVMNCKSLTKMSRLRYVKWHFPKFNVDFLRERPGVLVKTSHNNAFASIIYLNKDWVYM